MSSLSTSMMAEARPHFISPERSIHQTKVPFTVPPLSSCQGHHNSNRHQRPTTESLPASNLFERGSLNENDDNDGNDSLLRSLGGGFDAGSLIFRLELFSRPRLLRAPHDGDDDVRPTAVLDDVPPLHIRQRGIGMQPAGRIAPSSGAYRCEEVIDATGHTILRVPASPMPRSAHGQVDGGELRTRATSRLIYR